MKLIMVCIYVGVILAVTFYCGRKTRNLNEFVLGGRSIGPWMSAFAYGTTYFSAVLIIGYAGKVGWGFGLGALLIVLGNTVVGSYLAWKFLAPRSREMTGRLNVMTMPEFLQVRYDSKAMKVAAALIIFVFLVPYSAGVFMGLSYLFQEILHVPYMQTLIFMAVLTGIYLVFGGYLAVNVIDFIQGMIMVVGVILMVYFVIADPAIGGITGLIAKIPELPGPTDASSWIMLLSLAFLTSFGCWGMPQMLTKFYAIKSEDSIKKATIVATLFAALITFGAYFTGSLTHLFFKELPLLNGQPNPDLLMPMLFNMVLPPFVAVVILLLVLSASMSTLASLVMVSSSSIMVDLVKGYLFPQISQRLSVIGMRVCCALFVGFSLYLAVKPTVIISLMALSWGTVAGCFLAPYVYGLYGVRTTKAGAWAGIITGFATSIGLSLYLGAAMTPVAGSLAMIVPLVVVPAVSAVTKPLPVEHLEKVFGREITELAEGSEEYSAEG